MKALKYAALTVSVVFAVFVIHSVYSRSSSDSPAPAIVTASAPVASQPAAPTALVTIDNFHFQPQNLEIAAGTTVTWQNNDDVPHTASSGDDPQAFDSGALDTDQKFSFTFRTPGRYAYYCKLHQHMTGVVTVK